MPIRVRATRPCFIGSHLREAGDEFEIEADRFQADCMERIEDQSASEVAAEEPAAADAPRRRRK
jgi:hypothetical protein